MPSTSASMTNQLPALVCNYRTLVTFFIEARLAPIFSHVFLEAALEVNNGRLAVATTFMSSAYTWIASAFHLK